MWTIKKYISFLILLLFSSCVYLETFTHEQKFLVQLDSNFNFDSSKHVFEVVNGKIEIYDFKNKIYKVDFHKADGGKTKIFGQTLKETSNGYKYDRLFLTEWEDNFNKRILISLSYDKILQLDSYQIDGITVYKLPKINY